MKMFILLTLLSNLPLVWNHEDTPTALKFGKDAGSYIYMGSVDFTDMEEAFSICSWVRRMSNHNSVYQYVINYVGSITGTGEIIISDSSYSFLLQDVTSYTQPTITTYSWNFMCHTFSYSTRTKRVFYNGKQIGQETTPSGRKLDRSGTLMFGNYHSSGGRAHTGAHYFGGELYGTIFLSIELSADQIKQMYNEGKCSNYSQTFADNTVLGWEDILDHERTGNVTEIRLEACDHTHPTEETTEETGVETTIWDFLRTEEFYNNVVSEELLSKAEDRFDLLCEFTNHTIDNALILHLEKHHSGNGTESEVGSEDEDPLKSVTYWKFLTGGSYYQKIITESLASGIKSQLELLAEFLGHRIDDPLIDHLIKHHQ